MDEKIKEQIKEVIDKLRLTNTIESANSLRDLIEYDSTIRQAYHTLLQHDTSVRVVVNNLQELIEK